MIRVAEIKQHEKGFVDMTEKNNACVTCPLYKQRSFHVVNLSFAFMLVSHPNQS